MEKVPKEKISHERLPVKPSFYSLGTWPMDHILSLFGIEKLSPGTRFEPPPAIPFGGVKEHLSCCLGSLRSFLIAMFVIYFVHDDYFELIDGKKLQLADFSWQWPIFLRNLIGCWIICGGWDYFLYFSSFAEMMRPYKIYDKYPTMKQFRHDAFWTTIGTVCASLLEISYLYLSSNQFYSVNLRTQLQTTDLIWIFFGTHIREPHDYFRHRLFHPWRISWLPDYGRILYKYIHKLHHKSYNTTAFSGTSMHPIEVTIFYSACYIPFCFSSSVHAAVPLALIIDCGFAAWLGHGGFIFPGTGDYYHNIHHTHFDCNYGTINIGFDWLFGTFAAREEDVKLIWKKQKFGLEDSDTQIFSK